jgi:hypothetical protein
MLRAATGASLAGKSHAMKLRAALLIACTNLAMSIAGCLPVLAATRHVVLLFDERVELPGLSLLDAELVNTLRSNSTEPIEIYREVMDLSRFGSNAYKALLRDFFRTKYADKKIDVAVAVMAPAFDFLSAYGELVFPGTPIVFCGLDRRQLGTRSLPLNVYGVLVEREFAPTVELALHIHPTTKRFVVVAGTSEFDKGLLAQAQDQFRSYDNRVSISYLSELPLDQLLVRVSQLPPGDIVLFLTLFQDGTGQPFIPHEVVERVSSAASVPVYGFLDQYLGRGITGGSLYSFTAHGSDTANMVLRLLTGAAPSQNLSENFSDKIIFDWRQMARWGISESRLPPNSEIYFKEKAVWEQYLWQIMFVSAIVLAQAGLILILLHEHRRRRLAEVQARQRMAELAHINRFSMAGELTASISHEINQPLGAILTNAETARAILQSPYPDLDELNDIVDDILQDNRRASEVIRRMRSLLRKAEKYRLQRPELSISDRGPGIPAERLKDVFEPFFTTKAEGMGMGLPLREPLWKRTTGRYPRLTRPRPALCSGLYCRSLATQLLPLNGRSADRDAQRRHIHGSVFTQRLLRQDEQESGRLRAQTRQNSGINLYAVLAARLLFRQARPIFRLRHPERSIGRLTLCQLSA